MKHFVWRNYLLLFSPERFFVSLAAENYFGLSTQVPMKIVFVFKDKTMATLCLALKSIDELGGPQVFHINASSRIQATTLFCMRCLKAVLKVL